MFSISHLITKFSLQFHSATSYNKYCSIIMLNVLIYLLMYTFQAMKAGNMSLITWSILFQYNALMKIAM